MYDCIPQKSFQTVVRGLELFNRKAAETVDIANFRWNGYFVRKLIKKSILKVIFKKQNFHEYTWICISMSSMNMGEFFSDFKFSTYGLQEK